MSNKNDRESPLVVSVLALQNHLNELERVGTKINSTDMTADIDIDFIQKLMTRFAECGQGVSDEVSNLSAQLLQARARAETVADGVSLQANAFKARVDKRNEHLEKFRLLGERVHELNAALSPLRQLPGNGLTEASRAALTPDVAALERELALLIGELRDLRDSARDSRMKGLEKSAESLAQTLQAVRVKLLHLGQIEE